jgi:phosphatidate cytidylyltransferase
MIPGHGGVSDRMDCQVIMGSFTYFYLHTFLRVGSHILAYWLKTMTVDEKLSLHSELTR